MRHSASMRIKSFKIFVYISVANLEDEVLCKDKWKPRVMFTLLDDILFIWNHSRDELKECTNLFNSHDESIKINCNVNETSVDILGVKISKSSEFSNHNFLDTSWYFKEADTHEKVFHPEYTFKWILKSQLIRLHDMEDYMIWKTLIKLRQFHQPRLVIRTFHRQGRCSRGGHLCNEHSEEKYSCSYK